LLVVIVVPPERLPEVMRAAGKVLRELRLASNTVMRELTSALDEPYAPPSTAARPTPRYPASQPVSAAPATPPAPANTEEAK
jgi:Sec-independent protein translocase protein TatA